LLSVLVVLALSSIAIGVALAAKGGPHPGKTHPGKAIVHRAASEAPGESGTESEAAGDQATDGVDAGGDHQCPPACAPGENP
jgi:hypothetical protein